LSALALQFIAQPLVSLHHARGLTQQIADIRVVERPRKPETLCFRTTQIPQSLELLFGFDALSNDFDAQRLTQGDNGADDGTVLLLGVDAADKGPVDLQRVVVELLQVGQ